MPEPLNVLLLEDDPLDADLVREAFRDQFPEARLETVATKADYLERLGASRFDLVLSDGSVPGCEGLKAFHLARERDPRLSFLIVSGAEESGRDLPGLQALGVEGVLSKSDLPGLGPLVSRVLEVRKAPSHPALDGYEHLVNVVKALSLARDLPSVMAIVRRAARLLTGADGATFVLRDRDLCHYADEDAIGPLWKGQRFPMHSCISGWAMTHRQPAVVEDIYSDPRIPVSAYEPTFVRSVVMVPIRAMDPIGAIGTYWARRRLPEAQEVRLLQALADTTAVAMENARIYQELESRVAERTAELEAFTYAVSHDLRAPIRHMHGFATILFKEQKEVLGEKGLATLDRISSAAVRMGEMVEGLLGLSRTSQIQFRRLPLDLASLAREVAEECASTSPHLVDFRVPASLPTEGDPILLRIALQNLLGNAWKFTGKKEAPQVELGTETGPDGAKVYFVRDNGAGFEPSSADRLFGVFQRLHTQQDFPGTGVGLASVQRIIRKHGGRIWATSQPGEGSTFSFTLEGGTSRA